MVHCKEVGQRLSTRLYEKNHTIPTEDILGILEAAILAPSGKNIQPWSFYECSHAKRDGTQTIPLRI